MFHYSSSCVYCGNGSDAEPADDVRGQPSLNGKVYGADAGTLSKDLAESSWFCIEEDVWFQHHSMVPGRDVGSRGWTLLR